MLTFILRRLQFRCFDGHILIISLGDHTSRKYTVSMVLCGKLVPMVVGGKFVLIWPPGKPVLTVLCANIHCSNRSAPWNIDPPKNLTDF